MRSYLYESKADIQRLYDFAGDKLAQRFLDNRNHIKSPQNDIYYWLKRSRQELQDFLDSSLTKNQKVETEIDEILKMPKANDVEKVSEQDGYTIYKINSPEASVKYGLVVGGKAGWCISGGYYDGKEDGSILEEAEHYFNEYLDGEYEDYFFVIGHSTKYAICVKSYDYFDIDIWDQSDNVVDEIPYLQSVKYNGYLIYKGTVQDIGQLEIHSATLFSADGAEILPRRLRKYSNFWWLRSPGIKSYDVLTVYNDGYVDYHGSSVDDAYNAVRPALKISNLEFSNLKIGDIFEFGGKIFEVISNNMAFCKQDIGRCAFRKDATAPDANDYEKSDVKKFVDDWFNKSIKEVEKMNESISDKMTFAQCRDLAYMIDEKLPNDISAELINYQPTVGNCCTITFRIDGDWKHSHLYFDYSVKEILKDTEYQVRKIDVNEIGESDSDWYTADRKIYICHKADNDELNSISKLFNESKNRSYGGAYDIEDDQYFTREELTDFAYIVCDDLTYYFNGDIDVSDLSLDNDILNIEIIINDYSFEHSCKIDMRRIHSTKDLYKYEKEFVKSFYKQISEWIDPKKYLTEAVYSCLDRFFRWYYSGHNFETADKYAEQLGIPKTEEGQYDYENCTDQQLDDLIAICDNKDFRKKYKITKDSYNVSIYDDDNFLVDSTFIDNKEEAENFANTINLGENPNYKNCYAIVHKKSEQVKAFKNENLTESLTENFYFKAYVSNLGKYNEGELVGEWVEFPIDEDNFNEILNRIEISDKPNADGDIYEEWFVTDYDCNLTGFDWEQLGEYPSYDKLQEFGELIETANTYDSETIDNVYEVVENLSDTINGLDDGTLIYYSDISNDQELGEYLVNSVYGGVDNLSRDEREDYFDYEQLGRDLSFDSYKKDYYDGEIRISVNNIKLYNDENESDDFSVADFEYDEEYNEEEQSEDDIEDSVINHIAEKYNVNTNMISDYSYDYKELDDRYMSAGMFYCGNDNASDTEIGKAYVQEIGGIEFVGDLSDNFDYEAFGRDARLLDNYTYTSGGCVWDGR